MNNSRIFITFNYRSWNLFELLQF